MQTAFRHFIGPSMPRLTSRSFSEALASYVRLFTEVRGREILRTSPVEHSRKFAGTEFLEVEAPLSCVL